MANRILLTAIMLPLCLFGENYAPWFSDFLQLKLTPHYVFRHYGNLNPSKKDIHQSNYANIFGLDTEFPFSPDWSIYLMGSVSQTRLMEYGLNTFKVQVGYHWLDEFYGDSFTLTQFFSTAVHGPSSYKDPILYHHGEWEWELHTSIGKECFLLDSWNFRTYFDVGLGIANRGSPYLSLLYAFEKNFHDKHVVTLFSDYWMGFGSDPIIKKFKGYGSIRYRYFDLGIIYRYVTCFYGEFGLSYRQGLYSSNFARYPLEFLLFWSFTLGPS